MDPTIESIYERLEKAQEETRLVLTVEGGPNIVGMDEICRPDSCWQSRQDLDRFLDKGIWQTEGRGSNNYGNGWKFTGTRSTIGKPRTTPWPQETIGHYKGRIN